MAEDQNYSSSSSPKSLTSCKWCGAIHAAMCPTVKAMEYHPDGSIKRVEFKTALDYPPIEGGMHHVWNPIVGVTV